MNFKTWIENETLGTMSPEMMTNRGSDTPASDEVKRTNLQPQVDSQEPTEGNGDEVSAIDAAIEHLEKDLPPDSESDKINDFKKLWTKMKEKWDRIKMQQPEPSESEGLGNSTGDEHYLNNMKQHPNMIPAGNFQIHGPGTFGQQ